MLIQEEEMLGRQVSCLDGAYAVKMQNHFMAILPVENMWGAGASTGLQTRCTCFALL